MDNLYQYWEYVRPHIALVGLLITWCGIVYFSLRRRRDWRNKRFTSQVNFSLNYIDQGELSLRTLLETTASRVWLNEYGVKLVTVAATKTRPDQPFIILKNHEDMNFVKRAILNVLSEHYSEGFLAHVIGVPVKQATFVFALTFENYADMRARKFRVLLMEEKSLQETFGATVPELAVEEVRHRDRIGVLRLMAKLAASPGTTVEGVDVLGHVDLGIVSPK